MDSADVLQDFLKRLRLVNSVLLVCNSVFSSIHVKSVFKSVFTVERLYPNGIERELFLDSVNFSYAQIESVRRLIEEIFSLSCCSNEALASQIALYCKHDKERHEETDPANRVKKLLERLRFVKELLTNLIHQYDYTSSLQDFLRACDVPVMAAVVHAACQHRQRVESFNAFKVIKDKLKKHNDVKIYQRAFELYGGWAKRYSTQGCLTNVIKGAMVVPSTSVDTRCSSEKLDKPAKEAKANVVNGCQGNVEQSSSQVGSTSVTEAFVPRVHPGAGIGMPRKYSSARFWKPQEDKSLPENTISVKSKAT
jgi:hypothetical protein